MTITALPTPPTRQDPLNFANRADAFLAALPQFGTEANALAAAVNADEIAAAASAAAALASQNAAASSASAAAGSAASAQSAANSVAAIEQRYLGAKTADPTLDNQGGPLQEGMLYFNTNTDLMRVYNGIAWQDVSSSVSTPFQVFSGTGSQTAFTLSGAPGSVGSIDVFISGVRQLPTTHYSISGTTLTFVTAPPAGTGNIFVRWISTQAINVPALGSVGTGQLADDAVTFAKMQNIATARLLGRFSAGPGDIEQIQLGSGLSLTGDTLNASGVPVGAIDFFATRTPPTGYLAANGAAVSRTTYSALFDAICPVIGTATVTIASPGVFTLNNHGLINGDQVRLTTTGALPTGLNTTTTYFVVSAATNTFSLSTTLGGAAINTSGTQSGTHTVRSFPFGAGDGSTTFTLPDLRGEFLRGHDGGRGIDTGRVFGSAQADELRAHTHTTPFGAAATGGGGSPGGVGSTNTGSTGGTETRPRNVAMLACIKF